MWIENTIKEIIQFLKKYLFTLIYSLLFPAIFAKDVLRKNDKKYLNPLTYLSLSCFLAVLIIKATDLSRKNNIYLRDELPQFLINNTKELQVYINLTSIVYIIPIVFLSYLIVQLLIKILKIKSYRQRDFKALIYTISGSFFVFYVISFLGFNLLFSNIYDSSNTRNYQDYMARIANIVITSTLYVIPFYISARAILKYIKLTKEFIFISIVIISTFSIDFVIQLTKLMDFITTKSNEIPIIFKNETLDSTSFIIAPYDTGRLKDISFAFNLFNSSDTTFILFDNQPASLINIADSFLPRDRNDSNYIISLKRIKKDSNSLKYGIDFNVKLDSDIKCNYLVLKPGEIKRVIFQKQNFDVKQYGHILFDNKPKILWTYFCKVTANLPTDDHGWNQTWAWRDEYQIVNIFTTTSR